VPRGGFGWHGSEERGGTGHEALVEDGPAQRPSGWDGPGSSSTRVGESQREREGEGGGCWVGQLGSGAHLPVEQGERMTSGSR
jgi:hypothetical protein